MQKDQSILWNHTRSTYPDKPLHRLIEEQAAFLSGKEALRFRGESLSYTELNESANRYAALLRAEGVDKGDAVGILMDRSPEMAVVLLAILKAGAAYVPLDPDYPSQRIQYMLSDSGARLFVTHQKYSGKFNLSVRELVLENVRSKAAHMPASNLAVPVSGNDLAYIIYTSGSTGNPKGVMIEHHSVVNLLYNLHHQGIINEDDKLLAITTISFDIAALEIFLPLVAGASIVLTDAAVSRDGFALLDIIASEKITLMQATPVTWKIMLAAGWEEKTGLTILCCGEALSMDLAMKLVHRCERLYNYYGPTETTIYSTGTQIFANDAAVTIGKPVANTQVYILDNEQRPVMAGEAGELYIGGEGVGRGYRNMEQATIEKFVPDPFSKAHGARMFRTGDEGKWTNEGTIQLNGRIDQQIKIRGYRIEPGEIEACLHAQSEISDAVVIAREDIPGNRTLVAYIITKQRVADGGAEILGWRRALQLCVPDFMIPNEFVILDSFPLLPNGKIDRNSLPRPEKRSQLSHPHPAVNDTERLVARVWAESLDLDEVGPDDDFFELGGHSLIAVQIMTRLEKEMGMRLPIAALFEAPTVRKLSRFLHSGNIPSLWEALVPVKASGSKPPLYIVHGDGLNVMVFNSIPKYMDAEQPVFGLQPKGLNGIDEPDESMEQIASYYIEGILKHNPNGPYFLAGYSFGGIVAFEMARQLQQSGREVKMIAMFDTNVGNINYTGPLLQRILKKISIQFPKMLFIANSFLKYPRNIIEYQWFVVKRKWRTLLSSLGLSSNDGNDPVPPHEKRIIEKHLSAYKNYEMKPFDGRIDLFRVQQRVYFLDDPVYLGWKSLARDGVAIHQVPGDHRTFLLPPNDRIFAEKLQATIDLRSARS